VNILKSTIHPFGYTGMPTLGLWNTHLKKWLTLREAWEYIHNKLMDYEAHLIGKGAGMADPDTIIAAIEGSMGILDIERCTCKLSLIQHPNTINYLVFIRYAGVTRYCDIVLPKLSP
jgi:hypothetical protein